MNPYKITHRHPPLKVDRRPKQTARRKYPLEEMQVGDFIFVPASEAASRSVSSYISRATKDLPGSFSTKSGFGQRQLFDAWVECAEDDPDAVPGTCVRRDN